MKLGRIALGLLAGGISAVALGAGVAHAQPDDINSPPPVPIIDQILTQTPVLYVDPADEGGPSADWGGVGMYCQNLFVRCS
jgi:hypothetical protein